MLRRKIIILFIATTTTLALPHEVKLTRRVAVDNVSAKTSLPQVELEFDHEIREKIRTIQEEGERLQAEREEQLRREEEERKKREQEEEEERLRQLQQPTYNPYDLRTRSNLSKEQMHQMLSGTALETLVDAYYWYEEVYNVNAIFMMALNAHESAWGRSSLAISNNNLGGYKASDGSFKYFDSWGEFLDENFRLISEEYLDPDGLFYNGVDIFSVNIRYCTEPNDLSWSDGINQIAYELLNKLYK